MPTDKQFSVRFISSRPVHFHFVCWAGRTSHLQVYRICSTTGEGENCNNSLVGKSGKEKVTGDFDV